MIAKGGIVKLASFRARGRESYGVVTDEGIIDLVSRIGTNFPTLRQALKSGMNDVRRASRGQLPELRLTDVSFLPVIPDPRRILCIGINYEGHRAETGRPLTQHPTVFVRFASTLAGHLQALVKPRVSDMFDFEGELAVVIGRAGRSIDEAEALGHVAGYTCFNDGSVRDWQNHTSQFTPGKNFPATGGFGPWMVTSDEIRDPSRLTIVTRLNGSEVQRGACSDMTFSVPKLISYISMFTPLAPGDVIATGTPAGVGYKRNPQLFMKPGDICEVEITGIGTLRNVVKAE